MGSPLSCQDVPHDISMHVRQPEISSLPVSQPFAVDSQAVEQRGIEVVDMDRVVDDIVAKVVRRSVDEPRIDPPAIRMLKQRP